MKPKQMKPKKQKPQEEARIRRPRPARTAPIRSAETLFRQGTQSQPAPGEREPTGPGFGGGYATVSDAVSESVRLGYGVIEEQIERGRRAARRAGRQPGDGLGSALEIGDLGQRVLSFSTDLGALYVDLLEMMLRLPQQAPRSDSGAHEPDAGEAAVPGASGIAIEIETSAPSRVTLDLKPGALAGDLRVPVLLAPDPETAPLTQIGFEHRAGGEPVRLKIHVPADQPPGTYTGVVVEASTNDIRGTLSVRLMSS